MWNPQLAIHTLPASEIGQVLQSRDRGLSAVEVHDRLLKYGKNQLTPPARFHWVRGLLKQFANWFSLLLNVAAIACFIAESIQPGQGMGVLGWALLGVSLLNGVFSYAQVRRAERAMQALQKFLPQRVTVVRQGVEQEILSESIVPGDVLVVAEGERIPADARLIDVESLLVNNAPLTGESRSQVMTSAAVTGPFMDSPNIVFAGSLVIRGRGRAVVFATGHDTAFGTIAAQARDLYRPQSTLQRETTRMIRILTGIAFIMGVVFFVYGIATGQSLWVSIVFMLGIIVANVPEGLLPTFTLAMAVASTRMARKNVLVRSLEAVETLGAVHVICTDKTGTLTRNDLVVTATVDPLSGAELTSPARIGGVLRTAVIASEVHGVPDANDRDPSTRWQGDPLDVAVVLRYAEQVGPPDAILKQTRRHFPFDLEKRREAGIHADDHEVVFAVKGAWESLRPLIGYITSSEQEPALPASDTALTQCDHVMQQHARQGKRVIAVAYCRLPGLPDPAAVEESMELSLVLIGFVVLEDPLREDIPQAVQACHDAGIRVIMITGDHAETAWAIANNCKIVQSHQNLTDGLLLGIDLDRLSGAELQTRLRAGVNVFARTTPDHKLKIVHALQGLGSVVAMTGDGVNDAPALKAANVGIAMGRSGTDVARESADIVLLDDHFASIVAGVELGRAVYANMRKFTTYVLASNIPELVPFLVYILFPVPLALTVIQILLIDLGTDLLPAIGLGQEPPEAETMKRPPRPLHERLLSLPIMFTAYLFLGMIQAGWAMTMFFVVLTAGGWTWGQTLAADDPLYRSATGITLVSVILLQIGNVIGRRSEMRSGLDARLGRNRLIVLGIALEVLLTWAILYFPPMQYILGTGPVPWELYALAWLGIPLLLLLDTCRKRINRHRARRL